MTTELPICTTNEASTIQTIVNSEYQNIDGPAIIDAIGYQEWWQYEYRNRHRTDGSTIIESDGLPEKVIVEPAK